MLRILLKAAWAPLAVLIGHLAYLGLIGHPPALELVSHLLGGLAVAYSFHILVPAFRPLLGTLTPLGHCLLVLSLTFVVATLWEYAEFFSDSLGLTATQASVPETMIDLILGTGAGTLFVAVIYLRLLRSRS